jgi:predicted MFS family arabinose efflux permease
MKGAENKGEGRTRLSPVFYLAGIAFLLLLSRLVFSPLLPVIEDDLGLTHAQAGALFFFISLGYSASMLLSGFVAGRLNHRRTILVAVCVVTASLLALSVCGGLRCLQVLLLVLGAGCGLYTPSAIAVITELVEKSRRGRAIAIHEIGFNMSFVMAPMVVRLFLPSFTWKVSLRFIAGVMAVTGILFLLFGSGGRTRGEPPRLRLLRDILSRPQLWIIGVLFAMAIGAEVGVYSMIPTYLVRSEGMELNRVNTLLSLSRVSGLVMIFLTGWIADRFGVKLLIAVVLSLAAVITAMMGFSHQILLLVAVFAQPLVIICFFPAGLRALTDVFPPRLLSLARSYMIPFAYFFGAGLVPAGMGILAEGGLFSLSFYITGGGLLAVLVPLRFLTIGSEDRGAGFAGVRAPDDPRGISAGDGDRRGRRGSRLA